MPTLLRLCVKTLVWMRANRTPQWEELSRLLDPHTFSELDRAQRLADAAEERFAEAQRLVDEGRKQIEVARGQVARARRLVDAAQHLEQI